MLKRDFIITAFTGLWIMASVLQAGEIPFALDVGIFRAEGGLTRLEIYIEIDRQRLTYEQEDGRYAAHLGEVVLLMQQGQIVDFRELVIDDYLGDIGSGSVGVIVKRAVFNLAPGTYDLRVVVEDNLGNRSSSTRRVSLPRYRDTVLRMSSILLSNMIQRSTVQSEFLKRGLMIRPNVGAVYDDNRPLLWHYTEVYGLVPRDTFEIQATIWQDSAEVIMPITKLYTTSTMIFNDWGAINLSTLAGGEYSLVLTVIMGDDTSSVTKQFTITRGMLVTDDSSDVLTSFSAAELTDFTGALSLIQPNLDLQRFNSADSTDRLQMVRDAAGKIELKFVQDPSDYLANLVHRWEYSRTYGMDGSGKGQLTDQGRIILLYGLPDIIDAYPAIGALRRHQIWTYDNADSAGQVVFMDLEDNAEFSMVHATVPGGIPNEDWRTAPRRISLIREMIAVPAETPDRESAEITNIETAPMEPIIEDTLTVPEGIQGAVMTNDSLATQPAPLEEATIDTISGGSILTEPTIIDTTTTD